MELFKVILLVPRAKKSSLKTYDSNAQLLKKVENNYRETEQKQTGFKHAFSELIFL